MSGRGVLLVNLGSPASTSVADVRRYLDQFLMDPAVIDSPWLVRALVVKGFILPFRPKRTAAAYSKIWQPEGSPLLIYSRALRDAVAARVTQPVALAMRYGEPAIGAGVAELISAGVDEILLMALYPQHADSTRTTTITEVRRVLRTTAPNVALRVLPPFYADPAYLHVLSDSIRAALPQNFDLLLFSFHGLPERHIERADPTGTHCLKRVDCCEVPSPAHASCYRHQAFAIAGAVASRLGLDASRWRVSFQSRLGRLPWLAPYTDQVLEALPGQGVQRLAVACPAFVADNLETLEEIAISGSEQFRTAGGDELTLIPCLNAEPAWADLIARWCATPPPVAVIDAAA
jgi:ferrochelatase